MNFDQASGDKRSWKGVQLDYDVIMSMSDRKCSYCLTEAQVTAILGFCDMFAWPTRWFSNSTEIDRQVVQDFTAELERNLMGGCCDDNMPIQYRYTTDGLLEWSLNGGQNWTPAPQYDSRVYSVTFPPVPGEDGDDKKCVAATGMSALIKEQVGDQLTDDMSRYTLSQLITDWVNTLLQTSNPFQALITVVTNQIFALVIALVIPALTDAVYGILTCIFYCRMADDASFDTDAWQGVRADITEQISGIAGLFLEHLVYLLGEKGLTNLARAGGATEGDCASCACPGECGVDWRVGFYYMGSFTPFGTFISSGTDDDGNFYMIVESADRGDGGEVCGVCNASMSADDCCYVTWDYATDYHPDVVTNSLNDCGVVPDAATWVNHTLWTGSNITQCQVFLNSAHVPYQLRFTFQTPH
jgi:hypothetical protein